MKQTAIQISMINNINTRNKHDEQRMTSLEIAQLTGKSHAHLMRDIRKMELAWEKVNGSRFGLVDYRDAKGELRPCYSQEGQSPCAYGLVYVGNPYGVKILKCCASCHYKVVNNEGDRICALANLIVKQKFVCSRYQLSDSLKVVGKGGGTVKHKDTKEIVIR